MAIKAKAGEYTSASIHNLQFPDCVRDKPTLYVGSLGADALLHFVREVADNVIDEMLQERARVGVIHVQSDGSFTVYDDGPGVPFGKTSIVNPLDHSKQSLPTIRAAFGVLNTSGKYKGDAYKGAGGVHGQGAKAVNALSTSFEVWTRHADNDDGWEYIAFAKGVQTKHVIGNVPRPPVNPVTQKLPQQRGTVVKWTPDLSIVGKGSRVSGSQLATWLSIKSYFVPTGRFFLVSPKGNSTEFSQPDGALAYVRDRFEELKIDSDPDKVFTFVSPSVEVAVTWGNYGECALSAFTNAIYNPERGVHFNAFFAAAFAALQTHRKKRDDFTAVDLREGCIGLVNARLDGPRFDSQTKEKLVDERADAPVRLELTKAMSDFFAKNKAFATRLCERAQNIRALRAKFSADKAVAAALSKHKRAGLPAKAATAPNCTPDERECFIVEGLSAGGGVRSARNPRFQELLPLRGKPLNALRSTPEQLLKSEEIMFVLTMIGYDPKKADPLANRRVGKVILLSDPDPDGPLHGDTLIPVRVDKVWSCVPIRSLAENYANKLYDVLSWTGSCFAARSAGMARVTGYVKDYVKITFNDGTHERCSSDHKWPVPSRGKNVHRGAVDASTGLRWVAACELKAGDVIESAPGAVNRQDRVVDALDVKEKHQRQVTKVKTQRLATPEPVYCLTVPSTGNFVLSNGAITSNCHINALVTAAIWKCTPQLIQEGRLYVVDSPEYYALHKGKAYTGPTAENVRLQLEKASASASVHHIKGWGEIDSELLGMLAINPSTRKLRRVNVTDAGADTFIKIMSDDPETRRTLLGI